MTSEQAMKQLRLDSIPPTGADNYQYLIDTWHMEITKNGNIFGFPSMVQQQRRCPNTGSYDQNGKFLS